MATWRGSVDIEVPASAGVKERLELSAFVHYCVRRLENELGTQEGWSARLSIAPAGYLARITIQHTGTDIETSGNSGDAALAIWDAFCQLEQALRERRGALVRD